VGSWTSSCLPIRNIIFRHPPPPAVLTLFSSYVVFHLSMYGPLGTFESPLLGHSPVRALLVNVHVGHLKSLHLSKRRADVAPLHHVSKTNISTSIAARSPHNAGTSIADLARHWKFDVKRSGVQGACLKLLCDQRQPDIMVAASNDEVVGMVHTSVRAASMYLALLNIYIM
jgi:hypothetical protein